MALFSLGSGVVVEQRVPYGTNQAFRLAEELINDYKTQGLKVEMRESLEGERLVAGISNREGTKLQVQVDLRPLDSGSDVSVTLKGKVHVGGMQGMFASDSKVRSIAKERMVALLKKIFDPSKTPVEANPEPEDIAAVEAVVEEQVSAQESAEPLPNIELPKLEDPGDNNDNPVSPGPDVEVASQDPETAGAGATAEAKLDEAKSIVGEADTKVTAQPDPSGVSETSKNSAITANAAGRSLEERLTILKLMLDRGLITNDDFKWKKNELLASI
ncbi:MAG: hypothetical protein P1V97_28695 [Planctomycetota bacterium]|nr:hypothetical protein [Planctomycetota bacterium]